MLQEVFDAPDRNQAIGSPRKEHRSVRPRQELKREDRAIVVPHRSNELDGRPAVVGARVMAVGGCAWGWGCSLRSS